METDSIEVGDRDSAGILPAVLHLEEAVYRIFEDIFGLREYADDSTHDLHSGMGREVRAPLYQRRIFATREPLERTTVLVPGEPVLDFMLLLV
jgi:hypothetical protein